MRRHPRTIHTTPSARRSAATYELPFRRHQGRRRGPISYISKDIFFLDHRGRTFRGKNIGNQLIMPSLFAVMVTGFVLSSTLDGRLS
jgi:hypothetical protein